MRVLQKSAHNGDVLFYLLHTRHPGACDGHAEERWFAWSRTYAESKFETAIAQEVNRRRFLGQHRGVPPFLVEHECPPRVAASWPPRRP